jgi:hypothetical protein
MGCLAQGVKSERATQGLERANARATFCTLLNNFKGLRCLKGLEDLFYKV